MIKFYEMFDKSGYSTEDGNSLPNDKSNKDYIKMQKLIDEGKAEIVEFVNPGPSSDDLKLEGVEFDGVMCSATSEDMWGLSSIKEWIRAGQTTNFKFQNGNVLELTKDNLDEFESVWVPFRASFF